MARISLRQDNDAWVTPGDVIPETAIPALEAEQAIRYDLVTESVVDATMLSNVVYSIAPSISDVRESDVAFVREIASTSAAALGLDPAVLIKATDVVQSGQELVLEGFKETLVLIAKTAWTVVMNFIDGFVVLMVSYFDKTMKRLEDLRLYQKTILKHSVANDVELPDKIHTEMLVNPGRRVGADEYLSRLQTLMTAVKKWNKTSQGVFTLIWATIGFSDKVNGDFENSLGILVSKACEDFKNNVDPELFVVKGLDKVSSSADVLTRYEQFKAVEIDGLKPESTRGGTVNVGGLLDVLAELEKQFKQNVDVFKTGVGFYRLTARNLKLQTPILMRRYANALEQLPATEQQSQRPYAEALAYCQRDSILKGLKAYTITISALKQYVDELATVTKWVAGRN